MVKQEGRNYSRKPFRTVNKVKLQQTVGEFSKECKTQKIFFLRRKSSQAFQFELESPCDVHKNWRDINNASQQENSLKLHGEDSESVRERERQRHWVSEWREENN